MWTLSDRKAARVGTLQATAIFNTAFSPDGKWIAYTDRDATAVGTYVQSVTGSSRTQIGRDDDSVHHPLWSRDGTRLFYFPGSGAAVSVSIGPSRRLRSDVPSRSPGRAFR